MVISIDELADLDNLFWLALKLCKGSEELEVVRKAKSVIDRVWLREVGGSINEELLTKIEEKM